MYVGIVHIFSFLRRDIGSDSTNWNNDFQGFDYEAADPPWSTMIAREMQDTDLFKWKLAFADVTGPPIFD